MLTVVTRKAHYQHETKVVEKNTNMLGLQINWFVIYLNLINFSIAVRWCVKLHPNPKPSFVRKPVPWILLRFKIRHEHLDQISHQSHNATVRPHGTPFVVRSNTLVWQTQGELAHLPLPKTLGYQCIFQKHFLAFLCILTLLWQVTCADSWQDTRDLSSASSTAANAPVFLTTTSSWNNYLAINAILPSRCSILPHHLLRDWCYVQNSTEEGSDWLRRSNKETAYIQSATYWTSKIHFYFTSVSIRLGIGISERCDFTVGDL